MINVYDVRPMTGKHVSWDQFWDNLTNLITTGEDKSRSGVMCRDLPDEWQASFQALGQDDNLYVAWVRFDQGEDHFHFAFIAWDEDVLINYVNHVGEEVLGGEITSFVKQEKHTLH